tara:strand:- start:703 stop:912 length:210 start_codon:yes stop_codon:yes gene_type:complete
VIDHCSEELEVAVFGEVVSVLGLGIGLGLGLGGGDGHHGWTLIGEEALLVLKIGWGDGLFDFDWWYAWW